MHRRSLAGFTLVEILVVVAIVGILAGTIAVYAMRGSATSRDAKRQADLKLLQAAVEAYKVDNGRYPPGCNAAGSWSGEAGAAFACSGTDPRYIVGLAPKYIRNLPRDPNRGNCKDTTAPLDCGYAYVTNTEGTVYKIMAMNTVENEVLSYTHPMKSCDINGNSSNDINETGLCGRDCTSDPYCSSPIPINAYSTESHRCHADPAGAPSATSDKRFEYSYAVWGGFAPLQATAKNNTRCLSGGKCVDENNLVNPLSSFIGSPSISQQHTLRMIAVYDTTAIICK